MRARSCGFPSACLAARRDTLGNPLLRLHPPSAFDLPNPPAVRKRAGTLSWGFFPYSAYSRGRLRTCLGGSPPPSTLRSQGSSPLSGFLRPQPPGHFQTGTLLGFSLQGFPLSRRRIVSSTVRCPLDVSPAAGHLPPSREGLWARSPRCLGFRAAPLFVLRALLPLKVRSDFGRFSPPESAVPLLGFSLSKVFLSSAMDTLSGVFLSCACRGSLSLRVTQ